MSDAITLNPSKNDWFGSLVPRHTAKLISQGIEDNSLPLLPDKDGKIEIKPIYNANNGWILNAKDLVPAQITRQKAGYESNIVATKTSIDKAGTRVSPERRGFSTISRTRKANSAILSISLQNSSSIQTALLKMRKSASRTSFKTRP